MELAEKVSKKTKPPIFLPDEMTLNILCRLPAKNAMICRLVCRKWRDLTLTQEFMDLHLHHSIPMIIVTIPTVYDIDLHFFDNWWEPAQTSSRVHTVPSVSVNARNEYGALLSHAGLIAFKRSVYLALHHFIIFNPVDRKNVKIIFSGSLSRSEIYGVFLHPVLKEYCSLWKIHTSEGDVEYKILNLGPNEPSLKTISYPFGHRSKRKDTSPLLIGNYLYWMLEFDLGRSDIMEYDIIREEFKVLPCPVPLDDTQCREEHTHILISDGCLSFLLILPSTMLTRITIWRLENRAAPKQLWTAAANYTFSSGCGMDRAIAVVDGNLALLSDKRLLVCNLMKATINYFEKNYAYGVVSHRMSLVCLRNCKSTIFIDKDGQVGKNFSYDKLLFDHLLG